MLRWLCRCLPGISTLLLLLLLSFAFLDLRATISHLGAQHGLWRPQAEPITTETHELKLSQKIFMVYYVLAHIDTTGFALRLCLALVYLRRQIKRTLDRRPTPLKLDRLQDTGPTIKRRNSASPPPPPPYTSSPGSPDLPPLSLEAEAEAELIHAIIIPNYSESLETLDTTLRVLASHPRAATRYEIYLAMEDKESGSALKASTLISCFETRFLAMQATFHPSDLPGEIAGKSSNVGFAARQVFATHRVNSRRENVIITVIDSDTHLLQDYFTSLLRLHLSAPKPTSARSLYVCPIIFDRNAQQTNPLVRIADILWSCAGLSTNLPHSPLLIPTSVYSLPLPLAEQVGGWDGTPEAIGEDMHMLLKTYFNSPAGLVTVPVFSPASQCNVSGVSSLSSMHARYRQAQRHMWGCLDSGYAARRMLTSRRPLQLRACQWAADIPLLHLLWEAHILPLHFVLMLLANALYAGLTPASAVHPALSATFTLCTRMRNASFIVMQLALTLYDAYHNVCVAARAHDMRVAGIEEEFAWRRPWWRVGYLVERLLFPVAGVGYSAVPAVWAQICHFWTERLVYSVSAKPVRGGGGVV